MWKIDTFSLHIDSLEGNISRPGEKACASLAFCDECGKQMTFWACLLWRERILKLGRRKERDFQRPD